MSVGFEQQQSSSDNMENLTTEMAEFIAKLSKSAKQVVFNLLGYELFGQGINAPLKITNPEDSTETVGYFVSYATWHSLPDLKATSKTTTVPSFDLSNTGGTPYEEMLKQTDLRALDCN